MRTLKRAIIANTCVLAASFALTGCPGGGTAGSSDSDDMTGDDMTGDDMNGDDMTGDDMTGDDMTGDDMTGDDMTGDDMTGDDMTGDDMTGDDMTGEMEREPGPHESEYGEILFWLVTNSTTEVGENCTDEPSIADTFVLELTDTILSMKVADDGESGKLQSCTALDPNTCLDSPDWNEFSIDGSNLSTTSVTEPIEFNSFDCALTTTWGWTLEDQGETLLGTLRYETALDGDEADCASVEQIYIDGSTNGQGIRDCIVENDFIAVFIDPDEE